jgi:hypothetical protein
VGRYAQPAQAVGFEPMGDLTILKHRAIPAGTVIATAVLLAVVAGWKRP